MELIDPQSLLTLIPILLLVGVLIGSIGVGGILLVPALTYLTEISVHAAIAAAMFSYLFSGLVGAALYASRGSIRWSSGAWLCAGAMPGAFLGALAVSLMPADLVKLIIAVFVVFAGINALSKQAATNQSGHASAAGWLLLIGFVVGVCSAITGTGGPLVLVPLLVWLKWPVLTAVGLSQLIQLPISLLATIGNIRFGSVDFQLGIALAVVMVVGVVMGSKLAHKLPAAYLRRVVGVVLGMLGVWMLLQGVLALTAA